MRALPALFLALVAACAARETAPSTPRTELKLATWNLEWLIAPEAFVALRRNCVPEGQSPGARRRFIPCDVALRLQRSSADLRALADYARRLDADVIAMQEVDGIAAARRVFAGYRFCFSGRNAVQNLGFAIRAGIPHQCGPDLEGLSLADSVRRGVQLVLFPGERGALHLLTVHLKSGCGRRLLDDSKSECGVLAQQVPLLEEWVDRQAAAGRRFAVLGDFNRDLQADTGPPRSVAGALRSLWAEIDDGVPAEADLALAAEGQPFINCWAGQNFSGYIDHIVLGRSTAATIVPGSFQRVTFEPRDARRRRLSDHCPVAIRLRIDPAR
jgi:endonuclease/exonuclease/phosphatase family metal-dependent hydrolase